MTQIALALALPLGMVCRAEARLAIRVGAASAAPGESAIIEVALDTDRGDVAGIENVIEWAAPLRLTQCTGNPAIDRSAFFSFQPSGCEAQQSCSAVRALAFPFEVVPPLPDGIVLYSCAIDVDTAAAGGTYPLRCSAAEGATGDAVPLAAECVDGRIDVVPPPPTATPSASATFAPATPTGEATSTPPACAGDCDGDASVGVGELITAVRIALGEAEAGRCGAADADGDGEVAIAELVRGVVSALRGC